MRLEEGYTITPEGAAYLARSGPRAAPATFPYPHRTIAQLRASGEWPQ